MKEESKREIFLKQKIKLIIARYLAWPTIFPILFFILLGAAISPWFYFGCGLCVFPITQMLSEIKPLRKKLKEAQNTQEQQTDTASEE